MHLLEPEFDPVEVPMSLYVLGTHGVWMTTSFFAAAAIWFLLGFGLARVLPSTSWTKAGLVLFCIAGCGDIVMGVFSVEYPFTPSLTPRTVVHFYGGLAAFYAIALGSLSFSVSFRRAEQWRPVSTAAIVVSVLMLAMVTTHFQRFPQGMGGLTQRIAVALMLLWFGLTVTPWIRSSPVATAP